MLSLGLLKLLRVHDQSLLDRDLSVVVQVARCRVSPLPTHIQALFFRFALLELLFDLELRAHERLADHLQSDFFPFQPALLLALLLDDLPFDLAFGHVLGGCNRAVQIEPDILAILLDQVAQLGKYLWLRDGLFEPVQFEIAAEVNIF